MFLEKKSRSVWGISEPVYLSLGGEMSSECLERTWNGLGQIAMEENSLVRLWESSLLYKSTENCHFHGCFSWRRLWYAKDCISHDLCTKARYQKHIMDWDVTARWACNHRADHKTSYHSLWDYLQPFWTELVSPYPISIGHAKVRSPWSGSPGYGVTLRRSSRSCRLTRWNAAASV